MTSSRLRARLQTAAALATLVTFLVVALLAPGVLLLDPDAATALFSETGWTLPVALLFGLLATIALLRPFGGKLRMVDIGEGEGALDLDDLRRLHALPRRWVIVVSLQTIAIAACTVLPPFVPTLIDRDTQLGVVLLSVTVIAAIALPLYVIARAMVGQTLEQVPWRVSEEALRRRRSDPPPSRWRPASGREGRVAGRLAYAVSLPVALLALATSLLANAHVRAYESRRRREDAFALARGVLDAEGVGPRGTEAAIRAARELGFSATIRHAGTSEGTRDKTSSVSRASEGGDRSLDVPLTEGSVVVRFAPSASTDRFYLQVYALAGLLAVALAAALGRTFGRSVARDLADASREVRLLGTQDVLRGATKVAGPARFEAVAELGRGIESVAERFREFAQGRERMIEARESAQKMRDLFLASMSHDLRSPLNGILGFVALLQRAGLSEAQQESLAIIERRGRELLELIENILDAAKIEAGKLELQRDWTTASELLTEAVRRGRELALEKALSTPGSEVEVIGEIQAGAPPMQLDAPRLIKALINVVANAVKFCDRGVVRIRVSMGTNPHDDVRSLRIDVTDQGRGIPERELAQIFDAFRQPIRSRRHGGLGIGLSMTRAIVELHGGTLDVTSTPDEGSVFTLWVPAIGEGRADAPRDLAEPPRAPIGHPDSTHLTPARRAARDADPTVEMPALEVRRGNDLSIHLATPPPPPPGFTPLPLALPRASVPPAPPPSKRPSLPPPPPKSRKPG